MIKCVYGEKIGDTVIRDDDGNLCFVYSDHTYPIGWECYWCLKRIGYTWKIIDTLRWEERLK